ncbi:MAG TPA: TolC family protein [Bacteroidales bacterium]|nr:TolC family protein [Bacteroidales bacterium]HRZ76209.1 TolC family protein [Bacteroidales bacterium]
MMRKILTLILLIPLVLRAQQEAGIEEVLRAAALHYPSSDAEGLYDATLKASLAAERSALWPMVNLGGQATWQSEVTAVDLQLPSNLPFPLELDIPSPSKDQYRITLDVQQRIYQGGANALQKQSHQLDHALQLEQLRISTNHWKQQASDCFYRIRSLEVSRGIVSAHRDDLRSREGIIRSAMDHGLADQASGALIAAEISGLDQQLGELDAAIHAQRAVLVLLTGDSTLHSRSLRPTLMAADTARSFDRPELRSLGLRSQQLETSSGMLGAAMLPSVTGFGQLGYGRPGLNMLDDAFAPWALAGIRFSWNLWDNHLKRRRQDALSLQQQILLLQQESTRLGIAAEAEAAATEIRKYEALITQDEIQLALRSTVVRVYGSQLENGILTPAEYLRQKNEEVRTRLKLENHRIALEQSLTNFRFIRGLW